MALITLNERLQQLKNEYNELDSKRNKLSYYNEHGNTNGLNDEEKYLLMLQENTMCMYLDILQRRINLFVENNKEYLKSEF